MADFDLEQLKSLFQNLGDRLANTKGDENTVAQLAQLERAIRDLQKRMNSAGRGKNAADARKQNDDFIKEFFDEWKRNDPLRGLRDAIEENGAGSGQGMLNLDANDMKGVGKGLSGLAAGAFGSAKALNKMSSGMMNFADKATKVDGSMSSLVDAFGMGGSAVGAVAKLFDENMNAYRTLNMSAEGSIGSIQDMREAMRTATMNAQEFADAMYKGSDGARLMGGQNWAQVYAGIKEQTKAMGMYGYSLDQMVAAQNEYLGMLSDRGDIFNLDNQQIVNGLDSLLKVNDKMAIIMGKSRDDMLKAAADQARDPNYQTWIKGQGMNEQQQQQELMLRTGLEQVAPGLADIIKEMAPTGAIQSQELANTFAALPSTVQSIITQMSDDIRNGNIDENFSQRTMESLGAAIKQANADGSYDQKTMGVLGRFVDGFTRTNEIMLKGNNIKEITDKVFNPSDPSKADPATLGLLNVQNVVKEAGAMVNDMITELLNPLLNDYGPKINELSFWTGEQIKGLRGAIDSLSDFSSMLTMAQVAVAAVLGGGAIMSLVGGIAGVVALGLNKSLIKMAAGTIQGLAGAAKNYLPGKAASAVGSAAAGATGAAGASGAAKAAGVADDAARAAATVADDVARAGAATQGVMHSAGKALSGVGKLALPLTAAAEGFLAYDRINEASTKRDAGEMTDAEFQKETTKSIGAAIGGTIGTVLGTAIGGAAGTAAMPGVGTIGGGIAGGLGGGAAGEYVGDAIGSGLYSVYDWFAGENKPEAPTTQPVNAVTAKPVETSAAPVAGPTKPSQAEVALAPKDIKDNFENLQVNVVTQLEQSNKSLKDILDTLTRTLELNRENGGISQAGFSELTRLQEEMARAARMTVL